MRIRLHLAALLLGVSLAAGCQGTDPAREQFRLDGIAQMEQGDYEGAIASFDEAIAHSDGRVGDFELDVLKYRGEAEYKLGDYPRRRTPTTSFSRWTGSRRTTTI